MSLGAVTLRGHKYVLPYIISLCIRLETYIKHHSDDVNMPGSEGFLGNTITFHKPVLFSLANLQHPAKTLDSWRRFFV